MNGDKLGRQGGSGSQERNHEGRQAWETRRQRQPRTESSRETILGDKAPAASEVMKGDKLEEEGGGGSQEQSHERRQRQPKVKS